MRFEWDPEKAAQNLSKHGVDFGEGSTTFGDTLARIIDDPEHSFDEERFILLGWSSQGRLLVVVFTEQETDTIRIISVRKAQPRERRDYENTKERS